MITRYIERSVLIFLLFCSLSSLNARAGDFASRDLIGFSADGRYFAFEQFGIQDGSGFPYSEIFILDTTNDNWVKGSPIRKRIDDENARLNAVRQQARQQADALLSKLAIDQPGEFLASRPRAEMGGNPQQAVVNRAYRFFPPRTDPVVFALTEKTMEPGKCSQFTERPVKGFTLTMTPEGEDSITLHDDTALPASRGCALGYAISDILRIKSGNKTSYAVLIHVDKVAFEGPDGRFIAVTGQLPSNAE